MITDNEEKEKKIIPSIFAESIYKLDGRPFRLTDRHYLKPIYDGGIENGMIIYYFNDSGEIVSHQFGGDS